MAKRTIAILELSTNNLRRITAAGEMICDAISRIPSKGFNILDIP